MGNNASVPQPKETAQKLYQKMKNKGGYKKVRISWKCTKALLKKAASAGFEFGAKFMLTKMLPLATAIPATAGLGAALLVGSLASDVLSGASEDTSSKIIAAIRKVLNEEKEQEICNITISYVNRCKIFETSHEKLCEEAKVYERDLFNQLTRISNPMLQLPENATVQNFHSWLKSACFHLQMLSDMITLGVRDPNEVLKAAKIHSNTMKELGSAVKKQLSSVIVLTSFLLSIRLTDNEAGQSVYIYYPYFNLKEIKDKYLELLFDDQCKSVAEKFNSIIADFLAGKLGGKGLPLELVSLPHCPTSAA
ncbi:uncharacterized protein [Heptranchias perlo]|uniref:uncharacterized protein n=1 Tax=Heptranchias perlo TaxID=212740 RepID=UPI00355A6642